MSEIFERNEIILGKENSKKLNKSLVAVFGLGGVGSYCAEALARTGIGKLILVDFDTVDITNINRQIIALNSTVGKPKAEVCADRLKDINPEIIIDTKNQKIDENTDLSFIKNADYVVDAIDDIKAKVKIIKYCKEFNIPVISAMGAGNKTDPTKFEVTDIGKTSVCPVAKKIRKILREQNIKKLKVVYSKEDSTPPEIGENGRPIIGSLAFVPSVMGLIIAREVVFDIIGDILND